MADRLDTNFFLFFKEYSDAVSADYESARKYLEENGKNIDAFTKRMMKIIRVKQLEHNAATKKQEFEKAASLRQRVVEKVKELMEVPGFSLFEFMKQENFTLQNRNLEQLNTEEVENILQDYLYLKMCGESDVGDSKHK